MVRQRGFEPPTSALKVRYSSTELLAHIWWRVRDLNSWLPPWKGGGFTARLTRRIYASSFRGVQHFLALNQVVLHLFHIHNVANHVGGLVSWAYDLLKPNRWAESNRRPRTSARCSPWLSYIDVHLCLSKVSTRLSTRSSCFPPIFGNAPHEFYFGEASVELAFPPFPVAFFTH